MQVMIQKNWLLLPIADERPVCKVTLEDGLGNAVMVPFTAALSCAPRHWAPVDVSAWAGRHLTLRWEALQAGQVLPDETSLPLQQADAPYARQGELYRERLRPLQHFTATFGWLNDPNGLVYFNGEYHLFYQHNPYGTRWGNMHWGHATSPDLVHWTDWGDVLAPDALGAVYSGSAFVDETNAYGFGRLPKRPVLLLLYTAAGEPFTQCLAYSQDGRTFTRYAGNPVIPNLAPDNRDPKMFRRDEDGRCHVVLYTRRAGEPHAVTFLASADMRSWQVTDEVRGNDQKYLYECPDCFQLTSDDGTSHWVLLGANGEYALGQFDGRRFHVDEPCLRTLRGNCLYAAQTYSHLPQHGRRVMLGWLRAPAPEMPFGQCMSLPIDLGLTKTAAGQRLTYRPAPEIELLRGERHELAFGALAAGDEVSLPAFAPGCEMSLTVCGSEDVCLSLGLPGLTLELAAAANRLTANGQECAWSCHGGSFGLTLFIDRTCVELFAADGLDYMALAATPEAGTPLLTLTSGSVSSLSVTQYELHSYHK